jgi:hypothetical protein
MDQNNTWISLHGGLRRDYILLNVFVYYKVLIKWYSRNAPKRIKHFFSFFRVIAHVVLTGDRTK